MRLAVVPALLGLLSACNRESLVFLDLPAAPPGTRAAVVAFEADQLTTAGDETTQLEALGFDALQARGFSRLYPSAPLGRALVLYYSASLEELVIKPGPIQRLPGAGQIRPLPIADVAYASDLAGGGWNELDPIKMAPDVFLPAIDWDQCAKTDGCGDPHSGGLCLQPCPPLVPPIPFPAPPAAPEPPSITMGDCGDPGGATWAELSPAVCASSTVALNCPRGQVQPGGRPSCVRVGSACPSGDFPLDLPSGVPIVYVLEGASGGDGSRSAPYGTISQAISAAPEGAVVAIAKGHYLERLQIFKALTLFGACPAETIVEAAPVPGQSTVDIYAHVTVQNLSIVDGTSAAAVFEAAGQLTIEDVIVERTSGPGLYAARGTLNVRRVFVDHAGGEGLVIVAGATAAVERSVFSEATGIGLLTSERGSRLTARDVVVRRTRAAPTGSGDGLGVAYSAGAAGSLERVLIEDSHYAGVVVQDGAVLAMSDAVVRRVDGDPEAEQDFGFGLSVGSLAHFSGARIRFEDIRGMGLVAGAQTEIEDLGIRRMHIGTGDGGEAIYVNDRGTFVARRVAIENAERIAVVVSGGAVFEDLSVSDVVSIDGSQANGLTVAAGTATVTRARIDGCGGIGVSTENTSPRLWATDLEVSHTQEGGVVLLGSGDRGRLNKIWIHDLRGAALECTGSTQLAVSDAHVLDLMLEGTSTPYAVRAKANTTLTMDRFEILRSDHVGIQVDVDVVARSRFSHFRDGTVAGHNVGLQLPLGFDFLSVFERVALKDNRINLDEATPD